LFLLLLCFLITECDQGTFGQECKSRCHCLNGVGCNNVNGQCPRGHCDAGWKTTIFGDVNVKNIFTSHIDKNVFDFFIFIHFQNTILKYDHFYPH
jgi:hypothetical protein